MKKLIYYSLLILFPHFLHTIPVPAALTLAKLGKFAVATTKIAAEAKAASAAAVAATTLPAVTTATSTKVVAGAVATAATAALVYNTTSATTPAPLPVPQKDPHVPVDEKENLHNGLQPSQNSDVTAHATAATQAALARHQEKKKEEEKKPKNYELMCALIKSHTISKLGESRATFDLPGEKIPLSRIPIVRGHVTALGNHLLAHNVHLPGFGSGSFVVSLPQTPVAIAAHAHTNNPVIYPPSQQGKLVRLVNVNIPAVGTGDLILFVPNYLMEQAEATAAEKELQPALMAGSSQPMQLSKKKKSLEAEDVGALLGTAASGSIASFASSGFTVTMTNTGIMIGGPVAATVLVPAVLGGFTCYGIVKAVKLIMQRRHDKRMQEQAAALQPDEKTQQGCALPAEKPKKLEPGCVPPKVDLPQGCEFPIDPPQQPAIGCGDTTPQKGFEGCQLIPEPLSQDGMVLKQISEQEVKEKFGEILKDIGIIIEQERLDHITSGHIEGGERVYRGVRPKTLFNNENEIIPLLIETVQSGELQIDENGRTYVHDFGYAIGKTVDGKLLTKVKVVVFKDATKEALKVITIYPME